MWLSMLSSLRLLDCIHLIYYMVLKKGSAGLVVVMVPGIHYQKKTSAIDVIVQSDIPL